MSGALIVVAVLVVTVGWYLATRAKGQSRTDAQSRAAALGRSPSAGRERVLGHREKDFLIGDRMGGVLSAYRSIWAASPTDPTSIVDRIDPATNKVVATIPIFGGAGGGERMYLAAGNGSVYVSFDQLDTGSLTRIDVATNRVLKVDSHLGGGEIAYGAESLWLTQRGMILELDPSSFAVRRRIPVSTDFGSVVYAFGSLWVASDQSHSLARIGGSLARVVRTWTLQPGPLAMTAAEGHLWVVENQEGDLLRLDPASGAVKQVRVGGSPILITGDVHSLWFTNSDDQVEQLDQHGNVNIQPEPPTSFVDGDQGIVLADGSLWIVGTPSGIADGHQDDYVTRFALNT